MFGSIFTAKNNGNEFKYKNQINDVYSMSFGNNDKSDKIFPMNKVIQSAFEEGAREGRGGSGSIFVKSAGNGGLKKDNCGFEGVCNSIYVIVVGSIDRNDLIADSSEACASVMVVAYGRRVVIYFNYFNF